MRTVAFLKAEWKIQNECIADQHDEIAKLKAINAELLAACELVAGMNQFAFSRHVWHAVRDAIANAQPQGER